MSTPCLLEVLIPAYKRFDGCVFAARSVAEQIREFALEEMVKIRIVDDASPGASVVALEQSLAKWGDVIKISRNQKNKGMSANIYQMIESSDAEFCTILTDDDWLHSMALPQIVSKLKDLVVDASVGGLYTPRYSYLENGDLHCVVCKTFSVDTLIPPGPLNSLRFCDEGFILTGFIFRPSVMAKAAWSEKIENSFFTVLNFSEILCSWSLLFVNRNWFHHTVLNECHWESWGKDESAQRNRLYRDFVEVISFLADRRIAKSSSVVHTFRLMLCEVSQYRRQILAYFHDLNRLPSRGWISLNYFLVDGSINYKPQFWVALVLCFVQRAFNRVSRLVSHRLAGKISALVSRIPFHWK